MTHPGLGYQGVERHFLSGSDKETPEEKGRNMEKNNKERRERRNNARDIISTMDDIKEAKKDDEQTFEQNQITNMDNETNTAEKLIEGRVDMGEEILKVIEKKGGVKEIEAKIENLKKQINKDKDSKNAQDLTSKRIEILEVFLENHKQNELKKEKIQDGSSLVEDPQQTEKTKGVIEALREKIRNLFGSKK